MTRLEIRDIYKNFYSVELFYIKADQDGNESIWRKYTKVTDDEEKVLCDRFYHDASFRPELDTPEKIHAYLVDFLHKIEERRKQDIDEDDLHGVFARAAGELGAYCALVRVVARHQSAIARKASRMRLMAHRRRNKIYEKNIFSKYFE